MGKVHVSIYNEQLMNKIDYSDTHCLKTIICNLDGFEHLASRGDTVAHAILMDIKMAIGLDGVGILTPVQKRVIVKMLVEQMTRAEIAEEAGMTPQWVSFMLHSGLKRLSGYLTTGHLGRRIMTNEETEYVFNHFSRIRKREGTLSERVGQINDIVVEGK